MFEIEIKNLKTKAKIGITQKERQQYQTLLVTLRFKYKIMKTSQLNDLGYLKNYSNYHKHSVWMFPGVHRFDLEVKQSYAKDQFLSYKTFRTLIWKAFARMGLADITVRRSGHAKVTKSIFKVNPIKHFRAMASAMVTAFSTSSSSATLPVTMKCVKDNVKVSNEVTSFVLPMGATINMDGTALYQGVAAVFIAQAVGMDLTFAHQFTIVATAVLASIGTAAVPGAGIIMLVIILEAINVPSQGIALILGVDRILDMIRTTTNVTGDATIACAMDSLEKSTNLHNLL